MEFIKIDIENWNRKEAYNNFLENIPCTYSMSTNLDITNIIGKIKKNNFKFFPVILYAITKSVNLHKEFRMNIDENGNLGYYSFSNPCFTAFNEETENFKEVWTEWTEDYNKFLENYDTDMKNFKEKNISKASIPQNMFNVSCIPWVSFTGFNLNLQRGYGYLLPIFTIGKYTEENGKISLSISVQVHHAVCDGYHLSKFIIDLQNILNNII